MIYLSHILNNDTPTYGNKDLCNIDQVKNISNGDTSNNSQIHISSHVGTHIDAPFHFSNTGRTLDDYPADFWFCNEPWMININASEKQIITFNSIRIQLEEIPTKTDVLFIQTGFESFRNSAKKEKYIFDGPGLQAEIGYWIRENRKIKMIGLDFISLSSYAHREDGRYAHRAFLCEHIVLVQRELEFSMF